MDRNQTNRAGRIEPIGKNEKIGPIGKMGAKRNHVRIAVIGIIIEDKRQAESVNSLLHQYGQYIIGRMGLPYEKKQINIINIVVDAPADVISALSGKLGRLPGVSSKALYSKAAEQK